MNERSGVRHGHAEEGDQLDAAGDAIMSRMETLGSAIETTHSPDRAPRRAWLSASAFPLGIAGLTLVAGVFLGHQLMAWPPHEDETLALFVGRDSLGGVIDHVTRERGGAPLHFVVAWAVAHLGFGLGGLRVLSAVFALASLPLAAALGLRLAGHRAAFVAVALLASSWMLLFHGVYGRMYSLFLCLSLGSTLALLRALDRSRPGRWALWVAIALAMVAAHPYGLLVLGGQAVYVALERRDRLRPAALAGTAVGVLGIPFWLTDLVLASRFEVGVGGDGAGSADRLDGASQIVRYLLRTVGDMSAGWWPVTLGVIALALVGLAGEARSARMLTSSLVIVPAVAFLVTSMGGSASPESRHLVFVAPLVAIATGAGIVRVTRRVPTLIPVVVAALIVTQLAWAWHRTPSLFTWEPDLRQAARAAAEDWLAATSSPDDVLFGYDPIFLGAWEREPGFSSIVVPRADPRLALRVLERQVPVGRGIWVLDASRRNNVRPRLEIELLSPTPPGAFESRAFGPFLVIRSSAPTSTVERYLLAATRATLVGRRLGIGDADVNLQTIDRAARIARGYGPSRRLRSATSR